MASVKWLSKDVLAEKRRRAADMRRVTAEQQQRMDDLRIRIDALDERLYGDPETWLRDDPEREQA